MDRRGFLRATTAGLALAAADPAAAARRDEKAAPTPSARAPRIGMLGESNPFSWVFQSTDFELECRWADATGRRIPDLAAELVSLDVDVIVAAGSRAARAAVDVGGAIPVVFVIQGDPVTEGVVARIGRPGRNLTGLSLLADAELSARRLALLRHAVPRLARLGVVRNPDNALHEAALVETRRVAERHGVMTLAVAARRADSLDGAFAAMFAARVDAFVLLPDAMFSIHSGRLVETAATLRLPGIYPAASFAHAGGLMALHGNSAEVLRRVTGLVNQILDGARAAALPVQRLDDVELTVNLGAAAALGIELPNAVLARAAVVTSAPAP